MAARRRRGEEDLSEGEEDTPTLIRQDVSDNEEEKPGLVSSASESDDEESYTSAPEPAEDYSEAKVPTVIVGEKLEEAPVKVVEECEKVEPVVADKPEIDKAPKADEPDQDDIEGVASRLQDVNMEDDQPPVKPVDLDNMSEHSTKTDIDGVEGEEGAKDRENDDEDEKHPAFIPRKGLFFLHDDRIDMEYEIAPSGPKMDIEVEQEKQVPVSEPEEDPQEPEPVDENEDPLIAQEREREERARKKAERRANMQDKWSHDKFEESLQQPRTFDELVERYGFDIRALPADADFSKPIADSDDNSPGKRQRPQRRTQNPSGPKASGRGMRQNGTKTNPRDVRNSKPPQLKSTEDFPDLKGPIVKPKEVQKSKREPKREKNDRNKPIERKEQPKKASVKGRSISPRMVVTIGQENGFDGQPPRQDQKPRRNQRANSDVGSNKNMRKDVQKRDEKAPSNRQRKNREPLPKRDNEDRQQQPRRRDSKPDQRRRVENIRDQRDSDDQYDPRRRRSSPPRKRVEDPAPPIRTRRYSSDLSDEDFNHSRPPPPRRRKNQKEGQNGMQGNKVPLQVELANVRDILEKQGMYETQRKDDRKPDRRRRDMEGRKDVRQDEKGAKRYSARARPKHWNERQGGSQSPPNDQNFNDDAQLPPTDEFRDVLGKHFNVSSQRAKELIMQIKSQLTPANMPQSSDIFPQSAPSGSYQERIQAVDNRRNMTNEQMLAYQQQYQQLLHQNQQQLSSGIGQDAMQDMVRNLQQQEQYNRQLNIGNFYQQQGSIQPAAYDASLSQIQPTGFTGMNSAVPVSTMGQNALNSLMQHNGTTYFQPVDKRQNY